MKTCKSCLVEKELSLFTFNKNCKLGYENTCRECTNIRVTKWRKENRERKNKTTALWRSLNLEKSRKSSVDWGKNNKGHRNFLTKNRQAAKLKRTPSWLSADDLDYIKCVYQLAAMLSKHGNEKWHVDHVIPLQGKTVSGFHVPSNLQVIPASDNSRKSNKYG
jgi:hypothetical protein